MTKILQKNKTKFSDTRKKLVLAACIAGATCFYSDIALAAFNPDEAVKAGVKPLATALVNNWLTVIGLGAAGSAMIGQGDLRERGIRAVVGGGVAGAAITAIIALSSLAA